jgi:hypothetical protein
MRALRIATAIAAALGAAAVAFLPSTANAALAEQSATTATSQPTTTQPAQGIDPDTRAGFHSLRAAGCDISLFVVTWPVAGVYTWDGETYQHAGNYYQNDEFYAPSGHTHDGWTYLNIAEHSRVRADAVKFLDCI